MDLVYIKMIHTIIASLVAAAPCIGNYTAWKNDNGNCSTYTPGNYNYEYCNSDVSSSVSSSVSITANEGCPECGVCYDPRFGCTDATAKNYAANATINDGHCEYLCTGDYETWKSMHGNCSTYLLSALADSGEMNYDFCADDSDNSLNISAVEACPECGVCYDPRFGCTDATAKNYAPNATINDGRCEWPPVEGCRDETAINYAPNATINDGSCEYKHLYLKKVDSYGDGWNGYELMIQCQPFTLTGGFYEQVSTEIAYNGSSSCIHVEVTNLGTYSEEVDWEIKWRGSKILDMKDETKYMAWIGTTCNTTVPGCTDATATNYDESATRDDCTCEWPPVEGCRDETAINYNESGTCTYDLWLRMTDTHGDGWDGYGLTIEGTEYTLDYGLNEDFVRTGIAYDANVSCIHVEVTALGSWPDEVSWDIVEPQASDWQQYPVRYTDLATRSDDIPGIGSIWLGSGCVLGCTDATATNYDESATRDDDDSCEWEGCMDFRAYNYYNKATIDPLDSCIAFNDTNIRQRVSKSDFSQIEFWDVSAVTNMSGLLEDSEELTGKGKTFLCGWNVTNGTLVDNFTTSSNVLVPLTAMGGEPCTPRLIHTYRKYVMYGEDSEDTPERVENKKSTAKAEALGFLVGETRAAVDNGEYKWYNESDSLMNCGAGERRVETRTDEYGDEMNWTIAYTNSSIPNCVFSFSEPGYPYRYSQCCPAAQMSKITCEDTYGDGWTDGGALFGQLTIDNITYCNEEEEDMWGTYEVSPPTSAPTSAPTENPTIAPTVAIVQKQKKTKEQKTSMVQKFAPNDDVNRVSLSDTEVSAINEAMNKSTGERKEIAEMIMNAQKIAVNETKVYTHAALKEKHKAWVKDREVAKAILNTADVEPPSAMSTTIRTVRTLTGHYKEEIVECLVVRSTPPDNNLNLSSLRTWTYNVKNGTDMPVDPMILPGEAGLLRCGDNMFFIIREQELNTTAPHNYHVDYVQRNATTESEAEEIQNIAQNDSSSEWDTPTFSLSFTNPKEYAGGCSFEYTKGSVANGTTPTTTPTASPTASPTKAPTVAPTVAPTRAPTDPTAAPTAAPTAPCFAPDTVVRIMEGSTEVSLAAGDVRVGMNVVGEKGVSRVKSVGRWDSGFRACVVPVGYCDGSSEVLMTEHHAVRCEEWDAGVWSFCDSSWERRHIESVVNIELDSYFNDSIRTSGLVLEAWDGAEPGEVLGSGLAHGWMVRSVSPLRVVRLQVQFD